MTKALLLAIFEMTHLNGIQNHIRTIGRIAEGLTSYAMIKRVLNQINLSDPTLRYTETEWERLKEVSILSKSRPDYCTLPPFTVQSSQLKLFQNSIYDFGIAAIETG